MKGREISSLKELMSGSLGHIRGRGLEVIRFGAESDLKGEKEAFWHHISFINPMKLLQDVQYFFA